MIVADLNSIEHVTFHVSKQSVRDQYNLLITSYKKKISDENKASGISVIETPLDEALEEIVGRTKEWEAGFDEEHVLFRHLSWQ